MSLVRTVQLCALIAAVAVWAQAPKAVAVEPAEMPAPMASDDALYHKLAADAGIELSLFQLVEEVESRNPSLQAMVAAWQAAAQRFPQVVSLEDPTFMAMAAPASFESDQVEGAYALQLNQKVPWFGKRAARGRQAQAEANAAYSDVQDNRLQLAEATQAAFFDYYLARHHLNLNRQNLDIIKQFHATAQSKYQTNQGTQQDVLQADVELANQERRRIEIERMDRVAIARINTLLRREPFAVLPPPPTELPAPSTKFDVDTLQQQALSQRPDLAGLAAKVQSAEAAVTMACKDYYPDMEVFGRYDTFWQPASTQSDLRPQVGITINVPIYRDRLNAAVRQAISELNQRRAEYDQRRLDVQYEVATDFEQVEESRQTLQLYAERLLPATEQNVAAARANYDVNKSSFLELATAQRQLIELHEQHEDALVAYHIRLAALNRATGGSIPSEASGIANDLAPAK
jgi:outer membrane protein TolC